MKEFIKGKTSSFPRRLAALCYGSLPLVFDYLRSGSTSMSIVVVVSPLKALMLDQVHVNIFYTQGQVSAAFWGALLPA